MGVGDTGSACWILIKKAEVLDMNEKGCLKLS